MILIDIGEVGVVTGELEFVLRPSLYAMSQLGSPSEIVRCYASVMSEEDHAEQFGDALAVIYACADCDVSPAFGNFKFTENGAVYERGSVPVEDILPIARCLLKHGITGALKELPRKAGEEPEYTKEFDCREHVSAAIAHLGMTSKEAWQMTMTELVGALRAKFPVPESKAPGARAPSAEEHKATLDWFERVEAARRKKQGAH